VIKIHPEIIPSENEIFGKLKLIPRRPYLAGCRMLAESFSASSGKEYFVDFPVAFGMRSQSVLRKSDGKTVQTPPPTIDNWYEQQLISSYASKSQKRVIPTVQVNNKFDRVVIVNCIDHLYGHCLLKLLNIQRHLSTTPEIGVCVLIQPNFRHLIPKDVAEIWEFPIGLTEGVDWFDSLAEWFETKRHDYKEIFLSKAYSHLNSKYYSLSNFVTQRSLMPDCIAGKKPVFFFSYRKDRLWGYSVAHQEKRLESLYEHLKWRYPDLGFIVSGFGTPSRRMSHLSNWIDLRSQHTNENLEYQLLDLLSKTDCAIGVHGSNMLLPSGLSRGSVILMPWHKYGNLGQDILFQPKTTDNRESLLRCNFLFGDNDLTEIHPELVARVVTTQLTFSPINLKWFELSPDFDSSSDIKEIIAASDQLWTNYTVIHRGIRKRLLHSLRNYLNRLSSFLE
jgi:hypothetical protein